MSETSAAASIPARSTAVDVSVIMPMRNPGAYIEQAIESILGQGCRSMELLVLDDGSTDGSRAYVDGLRDPRVRIVDGPRNGIAACMNRGLELCRGEIVMRCDSDDGYPPGRIEAQLRFLREHPDFVAVCGPFSMTRPNGEALPPLRIAPTTGGEDVATDILSKRLRTHLCTFAFRNAAVSRIGKFREFFQTAEDIDFQLRLATAGPIGYLPAVAYDYRLHDASITHTQASALRKFFEETAYAMSRERLARGSDALMRGETIALPAASGSGERADRSSRQISQLLVGEAWARFHAHDRSGARRAAWKAAMASPGHLEAWRSLVLVSAKPLSTAKSAEP
jgi:glycosyltransferase involved in cell wall biosynthesis